MKLYNSLKSLILEATNRVDIEKAIKGRNVVSIYYAGDTTLNPGYRTIEPVCDGMSRTKGGSGNLVVRAWQRDGATDRPRTMPGWRLFRADRISSWTPTLETFDEPRPNFNPTGDKTLRNNKCFVIADFKTQLETPETIV